MKICFIEPHLRYGIGGIRRIIEVSNRLQKLGHDVSIFVPEGKKCSWIVNDIPTFKIDTLKDFTFDVSVFNLAEQYKIALSSKAKRKIFWVLAPEANYKNPVIPLEAIRQGFYFVVNSTFMKRYLIAKRGTPLRQANVPIIPAGINPEHFRYDPTIRKETDVLYFGSNRPWKGTAMAEEALRRIKKLRCMKMYGKSTPQNEMYKLYNKSILYVSAAASEGFSMTQLEAMACGCAVVTTDDGGSRDYIKHGYNALVVQRSSQNIRDGVIRLLANKPLIKLFIHNGLKTAAERRFNWDTIAKGFENACTSG
jgi:glycosyltransferase involved in cell wall biosynthesis